MCSKILSHNDEIICQGDFSWRIIRKDNVWRGEVAGSLQAFHHVFAYLRDATYDIAKVSNFLKNTVFFRFGMILDDEDYIFAMVDRVRSFPVFYAIDNEKLHISWIARKVARDAHKEYFDPLARLCFQSSGYTLGHMTLLDGVHQLQAGEALVYKKKQKHLELVRYYTYTPNNSAADKFDENRAIIDLGRVIDRAMERAIEYAGGRPIFVPLSGGLDSRLIVCKLHEMGYPKIACFSYGPRGNSQANVARNVAETLSLDWYYCPPSKNDSRTWMNSDDRKRYWESADGLSVIPMIQDIEAVRFLEQQNKISRDTVIINGQTGDFITGGHIPKCLCKVKATWDDLVTYIYKKHFLLYFVRKNDPKNVSAIKECVANILRNLQEQNNDERISLAGLYETFEWQERQCKYVVNGQRIYDYLKYDWWLPLWDPELMDFFETIPLEYKFNQNLYRKYLVKWDYAGLFSKVYLKNNSHIGILGSILAPLIFILFKVGIRPWRFSVVVDYYFGHYSNYLKMFPLPFLLNCVDPGIQEYPVQGRTFLVATLHQWIAENCFGENFLPTDYCYRSKTP